jgi:hypothetical protein
MSTQRREDRRRSTEVARELGYFWLVFIAQFIRRMAAVGTAPLHAATPLREARLATNSLQSGHLNPKLVRQELCRVLRTAAPIRAADRAVHGTPATRRSWTDRFILRLTLAPSVLERLHPCLPHHPAGQCRWTERYDGKRDLYLLHAA